VTTTSEEPTGGRAALVTGGNSGIGAAIVDRLRADGFSVMAGVATTTGAREVAARAGTDPCVAAHAADLAEPAACVALVEACVDAFGRIDVLVNNAAVTGPPALVALEDCTDERFDRILGVNLGAPFRCARAAVPHMRAAGSGVIVNIGSVAAFAAQRHAAAYAASKAGLLGLTRGLAFDLAADGIRVVFVAPGDIALEGSEPTVDADVFSPWVRSTPLGRRGAPADVAGVVAYLCSADAAFITGTSVTVDGGWLAY
jgi:NAD(P)-dependent dehydrogenase (short-subunit alcohol dehydrogenase family)